MLYNKLQKVLSDNISGSTSMLNHLLNGIIEYFKEKEESINYNSLLKEIQELMFHFASFAIILHFLTSFCEWLKANKKQLSSEKCLEYIHKYKYRWQTEENRLRINALNQINFKNKKILLHSNSLSIQQIFRSLAKLKQKTTIYQTVSYPVNEGIEQAKTLNEIGFKVQLITDSAVNLILPDIDFVILGTDAVFEDYFINKIGTYYIAKFAEMYKKDVYVISDRRKFLKESEINKKIIKKMLTESPKAPEEIYISETENITPINYYFEKIPNNLITKFIH